MTFKGPRCAVPKEAIAPARSLRESATAKLAKFFPEAAPIRISVRLVRVVDDTTGPDENTVIEYGTSREVFFASHLPLEFADLVKIRNSDGTLDVEACIVAVQYSANGNAVAARFTEDVPNWIVKP